MTHPGPPGAGGTAFLLAQVGGLAAMRFGERMTELDTTAPQAGILRAVAASPGRSQQALAGELGVLPSRMVAMIDELERAGLLERRRNTEDRRQHALFLTAAGGERMRAIGALARSHGHDFLAPLSEAEQATLQELLGRLAERHGLTPGVHPGYRTIRG